MGTQTMSRISAMVNQCRAKGCGCRDGQCKAVVELSAELGQLDAKRDKIAAHLRKCQTPPATVKPDWKFPKKPEGEYELIAYRDTDSFMLMWYSDTEDQDVIYLDDDDNEWPFVESSVYADDFERLGIRVEE